ncbi:hypothetical protein ACIGBH_39820 [Streptomyces sp. NPDC085929]|uniref:hypothetical protein n=1 Tax=Streptomyces sp. NPDC085929 TaxID=3365739 RepID=UPI0037CF3004
MDRLEAALPRSIHFPRGMGDRSAHAWDLSNPAICQSEYWGDALCADAVALGASAVGDMHTESVLVRLISFGDEATAKDHFRTWSTATDKPEGSLSVDGLANYVLTPVGGWVGRGVVVRQGTVIAKVEFSWAPGEEVPSRLADVTRMVAERIRQTQSGKNPTASMR